MSITICCYIKQPKSYRIGLIIEVRERGTGNGKRETGNGERLPASRVEFSAEFASSV